MTAIDRLWDALDAFEAAAYHGMPDGCSRVSVRVADLRHALDLADRYLLSAQAIEAGTDETRNAAQPEGRERGPKGAPK